MYLVESLKYNVPAFHEDRLTQVVAATFNESVSFQRIFLRFLGVPYISGLIAKTQVVDESAPSRPDLILFLETAPYVLIESKVQARSSTDQQKRHGRMKAKHFFLIARDPVPLSGLDRKFRKTTWSEFFSFLIRRGANAGSPVDKFLIEKLINFGRESRMLMPDRISKDDFDNANTFLTQLRLCAFPIQSFERKTPFNSLETISLFLERALDKVSDDATLCRAIKPFVRRLKVSSLYYQDVRAEISREKSLSKRRELRLMTDTVTLAKEIKLERTMKDFGNLYVRASFVPHFKGKDISDTTLEALRMIDIRKVNYRCEIIAGLGDTKGFFDYHDAVTFDDTEDLEFSYFYKEASRHWRKKLGLLNKA